MKLNFRKSTLIKFGLILALLVVAPFVVPFTLEFILMADLMGLEALIVFLLASGKSMWTTLRNRIDMHLLHITETVALLSEVFIFKPKIFVGHATVSSLFFICASSVLLACAVWMPVILASAQMMGT